MKRNLDLGRDVVRIWNLDKGAMDQFIEQKSPTMPFDDTSVL